MSKTVAEMVAQTFDEGSILARIAGITQDAERPDRDGGTSQPGLTKSTPDLPGVKMASRHIRRNYEHTESALALPPGQWVKRAGGVRVFVASDPQMIFTFETEPDPEPLPTHIIGELCECGCLVRYDERCPACLVWAIRDEVRTSWSAAEVAYKPAIYTEEMAA